MIVTFYSYKGGTGRTMALANIAALLARRGKKVLIVDFDLEAPGLWRYFSSYYTGLQHRPGLIDLLAAASAGPSRDVDWRAYVTEVSVQQSPLSLITSGRLEEEYPSKVLGFDWTEFFQNSDGGEFIERLRNQWRQEYDFTLIDSRTGITDAGGICTIMLPDMIVPVFVSNLQSLDGVVDVIARAQAQRKTLAYDRPPAVILPILSRFDSRTEYESAQEWLNLSADRLKEFYAAWLPVRFNPRQALERTKLPYVAYFSFGEKLPALARSASDPDSLGYALNAVSQLIEAELGNAELIMGTRAIAAVGDFRRPGGRVAEDGRSDFGVTMLGPAASGKTTFIAALTIALARQSQEWALIGADDASSDALVRLATQLTQDRVFPNATMGIENYRWLVTGPGAPPKRRWWRRRTGRQAPVSFGLMLADTAGEISRGQSSRSPQEDLTETLIDSRGIILLFDPIREFDRGDAFDHIFGVLTELAHRMIGSPEVADGRLPHHVAVCISKFDEVKIFGTAQKLGLITVDPRDPYQFPRVEDDDAREFFIRLSALSSSGNADLVLHTLERHFRRDRIKYFVTSAIGFYVDPKTRTYDPNDIQNHLPDPSNRVNPRVRGSIHPINVAEPLLWLSRQIMAGTPAVDTRREK